MPAAAAASPVTWRRSASQGTLAPLAGREGDADATDVLDDRLRQARTTIERFLPEMARTTAQSPFAPSRSGTLGGRRRFDAGSPDATFWRSAGAGAGGGNAVGSRASPSGALAGAKADGNVANATARELRLSCEVGALTAPMALPWSTDAEWRREIARVLGNAGVKTKHIHQATKIVLRVLEVGTASVPDAHATRQASELFVTFADRLNSRFLQMTEAELLASVSFLAESSAEVARQRATRGVPGLDDTAISASASAATAAAADAASAAVRGADADAADAEAVKREARLLRLEIQEQVAALALEFEYDPQPAVDEAAAAAAELQRLRELAIEEAKLEPALSQLRRFVADVNAKETRMRGQLARAQENMKMLISERQDQMDYLHDLLDQQLRQLQREKYLAGMRNAAMLPRAVARITMHPNLVKSKGKLILGPPPTSEISQKASEVVAKVCALHDVRPDDVEITTVYNVLNYIDVKIFGLDSVTGVLETLDRAFKDKDDKQGLRAVCAEFCNLETLALSAERPMERIRSDLDARFGWAPASSEPTLTQMVAEVQTCYDAGREVWDKLHMEIIDEKKRGDTEFQALSELLLLPSRCPANPKSLRHGAETLQDVLADAEAAQRQLKSRLAPGTSWAEAKNVDIDGIPLGREDEKRGWQAHEEGALLAGGKHWDPDVKGPQAVKDAAAATREHEDDEPFRSVLDVSRLSVAFETVSSLLAALRRADADGALDIVALDNGFRSPTVMGFRSVVLIVRQSIPAPAGTVDITGAPVSHRDHLSELRLTLAAMDHFRWTTGRKALEKLDSLLTSEEAALPSVSLVACIRTATLETLETTHGRTQRRNDVRFAVQTPVLRIPHAERG